MIQFLVQFIQYNPIIVSDHETIIFWGACFKPWADRGVRSDWKLECTLNKITTLFYSFFFSCKLVLVSGQILDEREKWKDFLGDASLYQQ